MIKLILFSVLSMAHAQNTCLAPSRDCKKNTVAYLCRLDQDDYRIFNWASKKKDTLDFFWGWFDDCASDPLGEVSTAVHETSHRWTSDNNTFLLVNGSQISFTACENLSGKMLKPKVVAKQFNKDEGFVDPYLIGDASSSTDFCYLLDELNAYGHDTSTSNHLNKVIKTPAGLTVDRRAGLVAIMSFLKAYADYASHSNTKTWDTMRGPLKSTITSLWHQAGQVLEDSCGQKGWGGKYFLEKVCAKSQMDAIFSLVGEVPAACSKISSCIVANSSGIE